MEFTIKNGKHDRSGQKKWFVQQNIANLGTLNNVINKTFKNNYYTTILKG